MADEVKVVFGASVEGLLAGVKQVEEAIRGLRAPIDELSAGLMEIAEVAGVAWATEKISASIRRIAAPAQTRAEPPRTLALGASSEPPAAMTRPRVTATGTRV